MFTTHSRLSVVKTFRIGHVGAVKAPWIERTLKFR
jgi:hypothetical protein